MIEITKAILLNLSEVKFTFITSSGPGGQNVNKVATAVQLRFDVMSSASLPENVKARFMMLFGNRLTGQGELVIKASSFRTQERNKQDAIKRLCMMLRQAAIQPKKRKKTKPTFASKQKRLNSKKIQGRKKSMRRDLGD